MISARVFFSKAAIFILKSFIQKNVKVFRFQNCCGPHFLSPFCTNIRNQGTKVVTDYPNFIVTPELQSNLDEQPYIKFGGEIHVVNGANDYNVRLQHVLRDLQSEEVLGFDAEFSMQNGVKICLIQLASDSAAVLWRVNSLSSRIDLPRDLIQLLNGDVLKVGHGSTNDAILILEHLGVNIINVIDTFPWAVALNCQPRTLQAMCALFLNCKVSKKMARSNWDSMELSPRQVTYAATDAWLSLRVYTEMKRKAKELNIELDQKPSTAAELAQIIAVNQRESRRLKNKRARQQRSAKKKALRQEQEREQQHEIAVVESDKQENSSSRTFSEQARNRNRKFYEEQKVSSLKDLESSNEEFASYSLQTCGIGVENLRKSHQDTNIETTSEQCDRDIVLLGGDFHSDTQRIEACDKRETARLRRLRYRKRKKEKDLWCKIGILD